MSAWDTHLSTLQNWFLLVRNNSWTDCSHNWVLFLEHKQKLKKLAVSMCDWGTAHGHAQQSPLPSVCPFFLQLLESPNLALHNPQLLHKFNHKIGGPLHLTFSRCVCHAVCLPILSITKWFSLTQTSYHLFIHQLADDHLGCVDLLATVNSVLLWTFMYEILLNICF